MENGFDILTRELTANFGDQYNQSTLLISGEFGRQLVANGDAGTDHGKGNTMLLIGPQVNGGVYGELFSKGEIARFCSEASADIDALSSIEHLFGQVCDWILAGAGDQVFPNRATAVIEEGLDLSAILSA